MSDAPNYEAEADEAARGYADGAADGADVGSWLELAGAAYVLLGDEQALERLAEHYAIADEAEPYRAAYADAYWAAVYAAAAELMAQREAEAAPALLDARGAPLVRLMGWLPNEPRGVDIYAEADGTIRANYSAEGMPIRSTTFRSWAAAYAAAEADGYSVAPVYRRG